MLKRVWAYRSLILVLCLVSGLVGTGFYVHSLRTALATEQAKHVQYVRDQIKETDRLNVSWKTRFNIAEEQFNERIHTLKVANAELRTSTERMSVALSRATKNYARASTEARAEYAATLNAISGQCIAEYNRMAKIADGHAADAERLSTAWPKP